MPRTKQQARKRKANKGATAAGGGEEANKRDDWRGANDYKAIEKKNEAFETYYKEQNIIPDEEWESFISSLKDELPVTFRITGYRSHAQNMLSYLKGHYISELLDQKDEDEETRVQPKPMPWYPEELAWQLNMSRKSIKKLPACKKLHNFLITETESGNISRQEAVSMIPPLLLDVKSHHKVLDMCAAPGSKTAQLIELLHAEQVYGWPEGFVVANDSDNKRCYVMVHQAKRLNSPCCLIVNHDASVFPTIRAAQGQDIRPMPVVYDRILCDVPCSGDGTLRKNFLIWKKWTLNSGLNLHIVQHRILQRGAELLEVGGRIVYSTCSFNPIENEAIIASVLQKCAGSLELIDVSNELPGLKRKSGLTTWKVMNDTGEVYNTHDDVPDAKKQKFKMTMWPPTEEEAERLNLNRCLRVFPHQQNTGGFFVAVLRKVAPLPWMKQATPNEETTEVKPEPETTADISEPSEAIKAEPEESSNEGCALKTEDSKSVVKNESEDAAQDAVAVKMEASFEPEAEDSTNDGIAVKMEANDNEVAVDDNVDAMETAEDDGKASSPVTEETSEIAPPGEKLAPSTDGPPPPKKKRFQGYKEDPFVFFKEDEPIWKQIKEFYSVDDSFPVSLLLTRCLVGKKRNLYMVNKSIKSILENNEDKLKVINCGVKSWSRSDAKDVPCDFRLNQEGIYNVFPFLNDRKVTNITKEDVRTLLTQENPFCSKLDDEARVVVTAYSQGSLIFVYNPKERDPECNDISFVLVGWRGKNSVRSYIAKGERQHILRMCNIDLPTDSVDPTNQPSGDQEDSTKSSAVEDATTSDTADKPAANGGAVDPLSDKKNDATVGAHGDNKVKSPVSGGRDIEAQSRGSRPDSPRRDRHQDRDRNRKRQRDGDSHRHPSRDEAQRKRDFYFYYY